MTTTRRAALGALASIPALAIPGAAMAGPLDPIFAAIERHRAVEANWIGTINPADETWCDQEGIPLTQEAVNAHEAASAEEVAALDEVIATVPTTLAGIRAAREYMMKCDPAGSYGPDMIAAVLRSPLLAV